MNELELGWSQRKERGDKIAKIQVSISRGNSCFFPQILKNINQSYLASS